MRIFLFIALACVSSVGFSKVSQRSGGADGAGGDKVGPRFLDAQKVAKEIVNAIVPEKVDALKLSPYFKTWLKDSGDASRDGIRAYRLSKFQYYVSQMELKFQSEPCIDQGEVIRGVSFDDSDPRHPVMCVSIKSNQTTSEKEAVALVFHEAGHFTGETNHRFLDQLGLELYELRKGKNPKVCFITYSPRSTVFVGEHAEILNEGYVINKASRTPDRYEHPESLKVCLENDDLRFKFSNKTAQQCLDEMKAIAQQLENNGACEYFKDRLYDEKEFELKD